jgi:hypothetical protein
MMAKEISFREASAAREASASPEWSTFHELAFDK